MSNRYTFAAGLLLGGYCSILAAQETIAPVVVTASRTTYQDVDAPYAAEVYTAADIADAHATDLYDFLGRQSSVTVMPSYGNSFTQKLDMRGFGIGDGYQNIVVTVDGRRLNNIDQVPQLLAAIPLASIERIEITKGSGSVLYGDGATAGAIHIYTRDHNGAAVDLAAGNHGVAANSISAGLSNETAALSVTGDSYHQDGLGAADINGQRDMADSNNAGARLKLFPTDKLELRLGAALARIDTWYPGYLTFAQYQADPAQNGGHAYTHQTISSNDTAVGATADLSGRFQLTVDHHYETKRSDFLAPFAWRSDYVTNDDELALHYRADRLGLIVGAQSFDGDRRSSYDTTGKINRAWFLQGDYRDGANTYTGGVRGARVKYSYTPAFGAALNDSRDLAAYELGVNHRLDAQTTLFASYALAYQAPDIDRFFTYDAFYNIVFNGFIAPAYARTTTVGANRSTVDNKLQAALFYTGMTNEIFFYQTGPYSGSNTNIDRSHKYGLELQERHIVNDKLALSLNYAYTRAIIDTEESGGGAFNGSDLPGVPNHTLNIGAEYRPDERSSVTLSHTYRSACYAAADFANSGGQRQAAFHSTDLGYSRRIDKVELYAKVENLFAHANGQWISDNVIYPVNYTRNWRIGIHAQF